MSDLYARSPQTWIGDAPRSPDTLGDRLQQAIEGYEFSLSCPEDGWPVVPIAEGVATGRESRAVARCVRCDAEYGVQVRLIAAKKARQR